MFSIICFGKRRAALCDQQLVLSFSTSTKPSSPLPRLCVHHTHCRKLTTMLNELTTLLPCALAWVKLWLGMRQTALNYVWECAIRAPFGSKAWGDPGQLHSSNITFQKGLPRQLIPTQCLPCRTVNRLFVCLQSAQACGDEVSVPWRYVELSGCHAGSGGRDEPAWDSGEFSVGRNECCACSRPFNGLRVVPSTHVHDSYSASQTGCCWARKVSVQIWV